MAKRDKMNKLIKHDAAWAATNAKQKLVQVRKIDVDSVPAGYLRSFKVSVSDNSSETSTLTYAFYACYDETTVFTPDRIIDHLVLSPGGGTGYLTINRKIWKGEGDLGPGGPVTIWAECSDTVDTATYTITAYCVRCNFVDI